VKNKTVENLSHFNISVNQSYKEKTLVILTFGKSIILGIPIN